MSESDSTSRRRPPTIDLTAKEVEAGSAGSPESPQDAPASGAANTADQVGAGWGRSLAGRYAIGGILGAIAACAVVGGFWLAGVIPPREGSPQQSVQTLKPPASEEIAARPRQIQQSPGTPRPDDALAGRIAAIEAQSKSLGDSLATMTRRVDDVAAASQSALAQAMAAAEDAKKAALASAQHGNLDGLNDRVAALESAIKSLGAEIVQRASNADDSAARATVAAEALRAAVERGVPYQAELAAVQRFGANRDATASLAPFAASGIPGAAALGRELSELIPALRRAAEPDPGNLSLFGRLEARAQKLVRITPVDASAAPSGDDAASLVARINADARNADIPTALADLGRLPEAARLPAENWLKQAEARQTAISASRRIAADALAALGTPARQ